MERELLSESQTNWNASLHREILNEISGGCLSLRAVSDTDKRRPAAVTFTTHDALMAEVSSIVGFEYLSFINGLMMHTLSCLSCLRNKIHGVFIFLFYHQLTTGTCRIGIRGVERYQFRLFIFFHRR